MKRVLLALARSLAYAFTAMNIAANALPPMRVGWVATFSIMFGLLYGLELIDDDRAIKRLRRRPPPQ